MPQTERTLLNLYPKLDQDPFGGAHSKEGPSNRHTDQDERSKGLATKYGKLCEQVASVAWSARLPEADYTLLFEAETLVRHTIQETKSSIIFERRKELSELDTQLLEDRNNPQLKSARDRQLQRINFYYNSDVAPLYYPLTDPPDVSFNGSERTTPSSQALTNLFSETDRLFGSDFMKEFENIGSEDFDPSRVNVRIKFLVETALFLSSAVRQGSPFKDHLFIPNVWVANLAQFDGILIPSELAGQEENDNKTTPTDPKFREPWKSGLPYKVVEMKADYRSYALQGTRNNKHVPNRHVSEIRRKFKKIIFEKPDEFSFPESVVFVHPRGTENTIIHNLPIDAAFLRNWRLSLSLALDNRFISQEEVSGTNRLIEVVDKRIAALEAAGEERRDLLDQILPVAKLRQGELIDLGPYTDERKLKPEKEKATRAKPLVPPWPIRYARKLMSEKNIHQGALTEINFGGRSFYELSEFLQKVSSSLDYDDEQDQIFKDSQDLYAWLTDLYKTDQIGDQKTPDTFLATTGDLAPYINDDERYIGDYSLLSARRFILEFGGQLLLHLRDKSPWKEPGKIYKDEFRLLRLMAEKLKDRTLIFMFGWPDDDGTRDIIGCSLKKKEENTA
jgi:hypothetical protein